MTSNLPGGVLPDLDARFDPVRREVVEVRPRVVSAVGEHSSDANAFQRSPRQAHASQHAPLTHGGKTLPDTSRPLPSTNLINFLDELIILEAGYASLSTRQII